MTQFNSLSQEDIFSPPLYLVSTIYLMISTSIKSDVCEKDIKSQKKRSHLDFQFNSFSFEPYALR